MELLLFFQLNKVEKMLLMMAIMILMKFLMIKVSVILDCSSEISTVLRSSFITDICLKMEAIYFSLELLNPEFVGQEVPLLTVDLVHLTLHWNLLITDTTCDRNWKFQGMDSISWETTFVMWFSILLSRFWSMLVAETNELIETLGRPLKAEFINSS